MLQAKKDAHVIETLETSSRWFISPLSLYLGALAARRLGDEFRCRRYALAATEGNPEQPLRRRLQEILYPSLSAQESTNERD
jgi:uncharacterized protein HemY